MHKVILPVKKTLLRTRHVKLLICYKFLFEKMDKYNRSLSLHSKQGKQDTKCLLTQLKTLDRSCKHCVFEARSTTSFHERNHTENWDTKSISSQFKSLSSQFQKGGLVTFYSVSSCCCPFDSLITGPRAPQKHFFAFAKQKLCRVFMQLLQYTHLSSAVLASSSWNFFLQIRHKKPSFPSQPQALLLLLLRKD